MDVSLPRLNSAPPQSYPLAMHRVWTIPELLQLIFNHIHWLVRNTSLARLARVNRQLSAIAIAMLWRRLDSTGPLLHLLSGCYDAELLQKLDEGKSHDQLEHLLKLHDLERFESYAPFIKDLQIPVEGAVSAICPFLYEAQSHYYVVKSPRRALLPNLSRITVHAYTNDNFRALLCFLGTDIKHLVMYFGDSDQIENLPGFLDRVRAVSPSIVNFEFLCHIYLDLQSFTVATTSLGELLRFQAAILRKVTVDMSVITQPTPIVFSALRHLDVRVGLHIEDHILPEACFTSLHFPLLRVFEGVFESTLDFLALQRFIDGVGSGLTTIVLAHEWDNAMGEPIETLMLANFLTTIGQSCPKLRRLSVKSIDLPKGVSLESMNGILQPLYDCTNLETLIISTSDHETDISWLLSKDDIVDMIRAWKNLEELQIYGGSEFEVRGPPVRMPQLGLNTIELLVSGCHRLRTVRIAIDARTNKSVSHSYLRWHHPLHSIDFTNSWIENPMDVAIWLNGLCSWDSISTPYGGAGSPMDKLWQEVRNYAQCLQRSHDLAEAELKALRKEVDELRARPQSP